MNKIHLHANFPGLLPQYITKTQNVASSHNSFVGRYCEIAEISEIDVASSTIDRVGQAKPRKGKARQGHEVKYSLGPSTYAVYPNECFDICLPV